MLRVKCADTASPPPYCLESPHMYVLPCDPKLCTERTSVPFWVDCSEQLLDCLDIIAIFQQMCCQGFPFESFCFDRLLKAQ